MHRKENQPFPTIKTEYVHVLFCWRQTFEKCELNGCSQ